MQLHQAYLLLGSNIGDRKGYLSFAEKEISARAGKILKNSAIYETAPWGVTNQDDYFNAAVLLQTSLSPESLFSVLKKIELDAGRIDQKKYAPRTLDIDILFYDDLVLNSKELSIPHPKLHLRRFALVPLVEIAYDLIHPVLGKSIDELLKECADSLEVTRL